jgi:hypothetical protein
MTKALSAEGLIELVHEKVMLIKEPKKPIESIRNRLPSIPLADCIMSGLAIFSLKYPSLLQFEEDKTAEKTLRHNLKSLFLVNESPCDTQLRERLDNLDPQELRKPFKSIFSQFQRSKMLEPYYYLDMGYLLSLDGTGLFSSSKVHCENCCEKEHKDGSKTYYHQMLAGAIVHPDFKVVIPFAPEPIMKQDGVMKNDCERNASKRFLENLRREHPHLELIIVEDGLSSNAPHIETLKALNMHFILGAKPGDHKFLFDWIKGEYRTHYEYLDVEGTLHKFEFINGAPLNEANFECKVNFVEYWETKKNGKQQHFSWVTDITITKENVFQMMKGGRARWKIENETFNTLKNQGYQFEHNFGHGYRYLSTVFAMLMMLAFLIDQVQQTCCSSFKRALTKKKRKIRLWEYLRNAFRFFLCPNWETIFHYLADSSTFPKYSLQPQLDTC